MRNLFNLKAEQCVAATPLHEINKCQIFITTEVAVVLPLLLIREVFSVEDILNGTEELRLKQSR